MRLLDIVQRTHPPVAWQEGDNIPWNEPVFSERMLAEHLTQVHDRASRRSATIDQHVAWIDQTLLQRQAATTLDLGCGPGLYSNRLAALGHTCVGIDYSPASIGYAREVAGQDNLAATYHQADMRIATYGDGYTLAMLLFGEFNVFSRQDAKDILAKAFAALRGDGLLLLEPHLFESLQPKVHSSNTWFSSPGGLFSSAPHLVLMDEYWDSDVSTLTRRYYIVDAASAEMTRYAQTMQAYTANQYRHLLESIGFVNVQFHPGLAHDRIPIDGDFCAIVAAKPG